MDDSCVVCADELDWVAYGACGHRDVCSTCVTRLRFVIGDRRCCICKTDNPCVFVTKAMGDYTRVITDFSLFPANPTEGKTGQYWYHEGTQAFFDDAEHYKMIRAMCRLSCSVCDKNAEEQDGETTKRKSKFKSIEQLKGHLYHQHRLFMCSLCLEGRKVFICEQKLYTRTQLNRHISTGDSEVDGSESERSGFMGHPFCEFCRTPFYGENELYMHMSTEHYTCHICQRQHPGQYDYYRNYDDLETHFRREHFLCENEACLEKKFIVFQSEAELKRHNALEHGGHMSRSKRNAVLQIPTSFRYRRVNEREQRRGRGRGFHSDPSDDQLSTAIQASLETAISDGRHGGQSSGVGRSQTDIMTGSLEALNINSGSTSSATPVPTTGLEESSFPPLSDREPSETSSRYAQALGQGPASAARLREESFPPLPGIEKSRKPKSKPGPVGLGQNTLSARLQFRNRIGGLNSARPRVSESYERSSSSSSSTSHVRPEPSQGLPSSSASVPPWPTPQEVVPSSSASLQKPRENGFASLVSSASSRKSNAGSRVRHSSLGPNLEDGGSSNQASASSNQSPQRVEDVQAANKTLVERIRAGLGMDEDKYAAFRSISAEYRQGLINSFEYLSYVEQFGLSNLVLELARLCPDPHKQKELVDAYNASIRGKVQLENGERNIAASKEKPARKVKGKGKAVDPPNLTSARDALAENFIDSVRKLQPSQKLQEEEKIEVLSKDGYRAGNSKLQQPSGNADGSSNSINSSQQKTGVGDKQRRKTSKFHRIRMGDGSAAALFNLGRSNVSPERAEESVFERGRAEESGEGLPVRGVWRNGGGLKLVASQRESK